MGFWSDVSDGDGRARFLFGTLMALIMLLILSALSVLAFIASGHWLFWALAFAIAWVCFVGLMTLLAWLVKWLRLFRQGN